MLRYCLFGVAASACIIILLYYFQSRGDDHRDLLLYHQLTPDSLVSMTPYVVGSDQETVGVLVKRWQDEDRASFALLPGKSWLDVDLEKAPSIGVRLISTIEAEFPDVLEECTGKFVVVYGVPKQHVGTLALVDIYSIQLVEVGFDEVECLRNARTWTSAN